MPDLDYKGRQKVILKHPRDRVYATGREPVRDEIKREIRGTRIQHNQPHTTPSITGLSLSLTRHYSQRIRESFDQLSNINVTSVLSPQNQFKKKPKCRSSLFPICTYLKKFYDCIASQYAYTIDGTNKNGSIVAMNDYSMDENEMYGGSNGSSRNGDSLLVVGDVMNVEAQKERRNSIREIMSDDTLTPLEKRRSIQSLMDGRRRSSVTRSSSSSQGEMARAAAEAAEYYQSDTEGDSASVAMDSSSNGDYYIDPDDPRRQPLPPPPPPYHSEYSSGSDIELESRYNTITNNNDERLVQSPIDTIAHNSHHQNSGRKQRSSSMPLWSEDTSRAAAPLVAASSNAIWDDPINISRRMEKSRPPCSHYERNCTIVSPCCGLAFGCRICHDECPVLPMPFARRPPVSAPPNIGVDNVNIAAENATSSNPVMTGGDTTRVLNWDAVDGKKHKQEKRRSLPLSYEEQETHHEINRFAIAEIICRLCYTRQSSKT